MACAKLHIMAIEFLVHKGILAYVTGETSPKRSGKGPNKLKRSTSFKKFAKKVNKIFQVLVKRSTKYFF